MKKIKSSKYIETNFLETVRDLTSFGDPILLLILGVLVLGLSGELFYLALGLLVTELVCRFIKIVAFKKRPNPEEEYNFWSKIDAGSMPSIHAARVATMTAYLFGKVPPTVFAVFVALLFIVSITRLLLKKHYLVDVVAGVLIGGIIGTTVSYLLK